MKYLIKCLNSCLKGVSLNSMSYCLSVIVITLACEVDPPQPSQSSDMMVEQAQVHEWTSEASFDLDTGTVMSIWGNDGSAAWSAKQIWAVGGQPEQGRLWTRVDNDWLSQEVPDGPLLNWVHGAEGHLWVVGNDGRALRKISSAVGGNDEWETFDSDTDQDLWGVFVMSSNEVWAVGGNPNDQGDPDPVLTRFDGEIWHRVPLPEADRSGVRALFKVFGNQESGEVFAVGMKGVIYGDLGRGWTQLPVLSANDSPPNSEDFVSLWQANNQLIAVGGRSNGVVARWNGQEWRSSMLSGVPGLNGVWIDQTGEATIVGVRGASLRLSPEQFEGTRERTQTSLVLHAVWSDGEQIWAVGGSLDSSAPWEGIILGSPH